MELKFRLLLSLFHLAIFIIYLYGFTYVELFVGIPADAPNVTEGLKFAGHWKFLTHWDHVS